MKILIILLSMTFLSNCKAPKIKPQVLCDVSIEFDRCRCRCYDLMQIKAVDDSKCGDEFVSGDYDLNKCDGVAGFHINVIAEKINPCAKETKEFYQDTCEK